MPRFISLMPVAVGLLLLGGGSGGFPAFAQEKRTLVGPTGPVVDARSAGARGDGQVATDCGLPAGSKRLTCSAAHFVAADVGKAVAVYGAGASTAGFVAPLASVITGWESPTAVILEDAAVTGVLQSSRVIWGTDDTRALQRALDALARPGADGQASGGTLSLPAGHYLVRGLDLPCARVGTFSAGVCTGVYSRIGIRGQGREQTTLENWDPWALGPGLVSLGRLAEVPSLERGNDRVHGLAIEDLTLRQVEHSVRPLSALWAHATSDVRVARTAGLNRSYECYIMGGGVKSIRWEVVDNIMGPCGNGGPASPTSTSALNLNGADWTASRNVVTGSPQAVEMGSRRGVLTDNVFIGTSVTGSPKIGVAIGSSGSGIWSNLVARNRITDFNVGVSMGNTLGTARDATIIDNTFINATVEVYGGLERNSVIEEEGDTVVHGTTRVSGNTFRFEGRPTLLVVQVGEPGQPQAGLESVVVTNNMVTFTKAYRDGSQGADGECRLRERGCRVPTGFLGADGPWGGGPAWRPGRAQRAGDLTVPLRANGYFYRCVTAGTTGTVEPRFPTGVGATVTDGTAVWSVGGPRPLLTVADNRLTGPAGALGSGRDLDLQSVTDRTNIVVRNLVANFPWRIQQGGAAGISENVPAWAPYGDERRWATAEPVSGFWAEGTRVSRAATTPSPRGWLVTRAGTAAPAWAAATDYGVGGLVVPASDNGHVYQQVAGASCRSGRTTPAWPVAAGDSVREGTCEWREAGPAVRFAPSATPLARLDDLDDPGLPAGKQAYPEGLRRARGLADHFVFTEIDHDVTRVTLHGTNVDVAIVRGGDLDTGTVGFNMAAMFHEAWHVAGGFPYTAAAFRVRRADDALAASSSAAGATLTAADLAAPDANERMARAVVETWIGRTLRHTADGSGRVYQAESWFTEGAREYYAARLMGAVIGTSWYEAALARHWASYAAGAQVGEQPSIGGLATQIGAVLNEGEDEARARLLLARATLVCYALDRQLVEAGVSLDDLVAWLYERFGLTGSGWTSADSRAGLAEVTGSASLAESMMALVEGSGTLPLDGTFRWVEHPLRP